MKLMVLGAAVPLITISAALGQSIVPVTVDNFARAESDLYINNLAKEAGIGKLSHRREPEASTSSRLSGSIAIRSIHPPCSTSTLVP